VNEDEVRQIVRTAIARHTADREGQRPAARLLPMLAHASHFRYTLPPSGGPCLIEPAVRCNHCGYCESHGY
jgi:hypothetical protein